MRKYATLLISHTSNIIKIKMTIKCIIFQATCKRDHRLAMLKTRRCYLEKKREEELKQFDENTNWLHRVKTEMELLGQNGHIPKVQMCLYIQIHLQEPSSLNLLSLSLGKYLS